MNLRLLIPVFGMLATTVVADSDGWESSYFQCDQYRFEYQYPSGAHFYNEIVNHTDFSKDRNSVLAVMVYGRARFRTWLPGKISFSYEFSMIPRDGPLTEGNEQLLAYLDSHNDDGRFPVLEIVALQNGNWVHLKNEVREAYYWYFTRGFFVCVEASYREHASDSYVQKYSEKLRASAERFVFPLGVE